MYPYDGTPKVIRFAGKPALSQLLIAASAFARGCLDVPQPFDNGALGPGYSHDADIGLR